MNGVDGVNERWLLPEFFFDACESSFAESLRLTEYDLDDILGIFRGDAAVVFEAHLADGEGYGVGHEAPCDLIFPAILPEQRKESAIIAV